ncbi:aldehyde dehydrogenase family protein [Thermoanaerobacterium thermosaccharolyticum]|uniref:NAD-dependent aldehyde dehydrogenase n=1 Tax=Thermoanaerobacterium thermosaccharolyticum M0795 TaxID=698948 RepID=L0IN83_THETR|nr:aldehyde dehydrogenase family protein [Thermoanaerobacterium thermosaccharolyticum]AGB19701.1 NAD-dependent aldehyde dehydrogenase [Thermoanaerobacterium thermosaccharolyticum M0795]
MEINDNMISEIIERVLKEVQKKSINDRYQNGIYDRMEDAIEAAYEAQKKLMKMSIEQRERLISAMRKAILDNAKSCAKLSVEETGMGRVDHKYLKLKLVAEKTPGTEVLTTKAYSGDKGLTLVEMAPFGVIGSITPSTNPAETVCCNSIGMIAAGNTVVFSPHPGAIKSSLMAVEFLNKAIIEAGGPENLITSVRKPSIEFTDVMINHPKINLLVATGGPAIVKKVLSSGKKAIGAGAGNPPCVVDETADIKKAARDIILGCTFDNNLPCIAEKEVIAVESIYEELIENMKKNGAYEITDDEAEKLADIVLTKKEELKAEGCSINRPKFEYSVNKKWVGKDAKVLLEQIGINVGDDIVCIIYRCDKQHPFVQEELMMPILPIVKVKNIDEAINVAVEVEHGNHHTAEMHSKNIDNLTRFAKAINTTIFVKNAPSYAGIGFGGEGYTTFTIAGPTGEGLTCAATFTRQRRCVMVDSFRIV